MNYLRNTQHRNYAILEKKIKLLEETYFHLCLILKLANQYEDGWHNEGEKFSAYLDRIMSGIASHEREIGDFPYKICRLNLDKKPSACLDALKQLSSPDYSPPDLNKILNDLQNLWAYWIECRPTKTYSLCPPPEIFEDGLDLALAKLMGVAGNWKRLLLNHMNREVLRIVASSKKKRAKAEEWKSFVLAIYEHGEPIAPRTRLSKAIKAIREQFDESRGNKEAPWGEIPVDKKKFKTPQRDSIIEWFKAEGILERDFQKVGRYWIKKMLT